MILYTNDTQSFDPEVLNRINTKTGCVLVCKWNDSDVEKLHSNEDKVTSTFLNTDSIENSMQVKSVESSDDGLSNPVVYFIHVEF
jgi:hypothetical protein